MEPTQTEGKPNSTLETRDARGRFTEGNPGGPGRPKGETLKDFARRYLLALTPEAKEAFLASLPPEIVWRMAEGNPHSTTDTTVEVSAPIPLLGGLTQRAIEDASVAGTPTLNAPRTTTQEASEVKRQDGLE